MKIAEILLGLICQDPLAQKAVQLYTEAGYTISFRDYTSPEQLNYVIVEIYTPEAQGWYSITCSTVEEMQQGLASQLSVLLV